MALVFNCIFELPIYEVDHFLFRFICVVYCTDLLFFYLDFNLGIEENRLSVLIAFHFASQFSVSGNKRVPVMCDMLSWTQ